MAYKTGKHKSSKKANTEDMAKALYARLTETVMNLVTSDGWTGMLHAMVQKNGTEIGRYSFGNMLLIWSQMPEATAVCSYNAWLERGRQVRKGEKALRINAPVKVRERNALGEAETNPDGTEKTWTTFRLVPVFDVSQTDVIDPAKADTAPAQPVAKLLQGEAPEGMWEALVAQIEERGYTVGYGDTGEANGVTVPVTQRVLIKDGLPAAQAVKTLAHELAHLMCGHVENLAEYRQHRGRMECEAESTAYMISAYFGLDSSVYTAPYIGSWAGKTAEEIEKTVMAVGDKVTRTFRMFLASIQAPAAEQVSQMLDA
jgi:hypothetical protein